MERLEQEAHRPWLAHLSEIATADMHLLCNIFSSPGLCPWRAYVVTQVLASASVGIHIGVGVSVCVGTMFKFLNVCIVF